RPPACPGPGRAEWPAPQRGAPPGRGNPPSPKTACSFLLVPPGPPPFRGPALLWPPPPVLHVGHPGPRFLRVNGQAEHALVGRLQLALIDIRVVQTQGDLVAH